MISNYWYIGEKGKFQETRSARIGASEIGYLFPSPENPTESVGGYEKTALTLYNKKIGNPEPYTYSLAAEMGHFLENKSLELFIRMFFGEKLATEFINQKILYEMSDKSEPEKYQVGLFRHNVEYYYDGMIVHPDCIYLGEPGAPTKTVAGITVDLSKPFYIEAKSARMESTKRRDSLIKGYDFEATTGQGIPLKHYLQMQYQSALLEIPVGYLALLHNTSEFQTWRVDKDDNWQARIIDTVGKMLKHIEMRKPPKEMAISLADIMSLYPDVKDDFVNVNDEEFEKIVAIIEEYDKADTQIKNWTSKKRDASDTLGVLMGEYSELRHGADVLCKWQNRKGSEKLKSLKDIKAENETEYKYLQRKGLITMSDGYRYVAVKYKL